jgi:4-alpha-glucanotransferase
VHDRVRGVAQEAGVADVPADEPWRLLPRLALASRARLAVLPLQDVLGLGSDARMNRPGVEGGSWRWQADADQLTASVAARLRADVAAADRLPA